MVTLWFCLCYHLLSLSPPETHIYTLSSPLSLSFLYSFILSPPLFFLVHHPILSCPSLSFPFLSVLSKQLPMLAQLHLLVELRHDYSRAPWNNLFCLYPWRPVIRARIWTLPYLHSHSSFKFLSFVKITPDPPFLIPFSLPIQPGERTGKGGHGWKKRSRVKGHLWCPQKHFANL